MTWSGAEPGRRRLTRAEQPPRYLVPECRESIGVIHRDDDILVINKTDLAPHVGASLEVMERDATRMRAGKPFVFTALRHGQGLDQIIDLLARIGGLPLSEEAA